MSKKLIQWFALWELWRKTKWICVIYPFGWGVHLAHGVPNFTQPPIPTQPITKGMFKLQSHTPFWIHDHLYFIPPAPGTGSKQQRDKEKKETKEDRWEQNEHTCVNALEPNEPLRTPQKQDLTIDLNEFVHLHHADWFDSIVSHHHLNPIDPTQPRATPNLSHATFLRWYP